MMPGSFSRKCSQVRGFIKLREKFQSSFDLLEALIARGQKFRKRLKFQDRYVTFFRWRSLILKLCTLNDRLQQYSPEDDAFIYHVLLYH